jgi:hypothetical protein
MKGDTYLPSITQRHHMIDVNVGCSTPRRAVVRAEPAAAGACACRVGYDVCAVALEDCFARVAGAGLRDPVGEQVARVAVLRALGGDGEAGELGAGFGGGGDVGGCAGDEGGWGCGDAERGGESEEDCGLHCCGMGGGR